MGFDGSNAAYRALDTATHLTGYGSTLTVVHVAAEGARTSSVLEDARDRVRRQQVTATYVQRTGEAAHELLEVARELDVELVVVGRRAEDGDERSTPGSVSGAVVRRALCDVLVVT